MGYWAKDHSYVRDDADATPRMTQGDAWEANQRVDKALQDWEAQEQKRKEAVKSFNAEYSESRNAIEKQRMDAMEYRRNQKEAIRIIVEQKRQEYNQKSWFGKGIAKLRGKTFNKTINQIENYAAKRVENMSPDQLKYFIETNSEQQGRSM